MIVIIIIISYEPAHDKTYKMACAPSRLKSAWTCTQSNQSPHCPHEKRLIKLDALADRNLLGTCHFAGFVMRWLIYQFIKPLLDNKMPIFEGYRVFNRDANHSDYCRIIPFFKFDFHITTLGK